LDAYLKGKEIHTIYYAGYATNNCVWGNPTGIKAMSELGYNVVLIEDASLSGAYQLLSHEQVLEKIQKVGGLTTVNEVMRMYQ
jgi:nicotinamidase-related amidase